MTTLVVKDPPFRCAIEHSDTGNGKNVRDPSDLRLGSEGWQCVPFTSCFLTLRNKEGISYLSIMPVLVSVASE